MAKIETYLPALNRVVAEVTEGKGKKKAVHHVWHDTTKDVEVTGIEDAECPLTGDSVQTGLAAGVRIWFRPLQLDRRVVLEAGDVDEATLNDTLTMIDYDVPSYGETEGFTPCPELRRYAVPMTKSVWLVRSGNTPWNFIARMRSMGVKIDTSKLDPQETRRKVARALLFVADQINERVASFTESARRAEAALAEHDADADESERAAALKKYRKQAAAIAHAAKEYAENQAEGLAAFAVNLSAVNMPGLRAHAANIRRVMDERASAYAAGAAALAASADSTAQALAPLAAADQLPVHVMSDALREAGDDKAADAINDTFDLV